MSDFPCCEPGGVPDVDYGPVWVEPVEAPAKPPFGSDARAEYDRRGAAFPQLDALRYAATYGQAGEDEAPLFLAAADEIERLQAAVQIAVDVFEMLHQMPGLLGHFLDTDDNDGEKFRLAAADLGIFPSPQVDERLAALARIGVARGVNG